MAAAIVTMLAGTSVISTTAFIASSPLVPGVSRPHRVGVHSTRNGNNQDFGPEVMASLGESSRRRPLVSSAQSSRTRRTRRCSNSDELFRSRDGHVRQFQVLRATRNEADSSDFGGGQPVEHEEPVYRRTRRVREQQLIRHSSTTATSECKNAPSEDNVWRQSVFEFTELNDPRTNLASTSQSSPRDPLGDDTSPGEHKEAVASDTTGLVEDALFSADAQTPEWFRFREKEALSRAEVDDSVKELRGSHAATVELAIQLGLPASASFEEIRAAYRLEIKRCHPDAAGIASNEFRIKALERRFQRLTSSWDAFVAAHKDPSEAAAPIEGPNPATNAVAAAVAKRAASLQEDPRDSPSDAPDDAQEHRDVGGSSC